MVSGDGRLGSDDAENSYASFGDADEYTEKLESTENERLCGVTTAAKSRSVIGMRDQAPLLLGDSFDQRVLLMKSSNILAISSINRSSTFLAISVLCSIFLHPFLKSPDPIFHSLGVTKATGTVYD
jgi:hypothetical protein